MAVTIQAKASTVLLFGIDAGIAALTGYIANDADQDYTSDTAQALDDQGSLVAKAYFNQMIDIKFNALLLSATTLPVVGTTVTIATVKYIVEKVSKKEKNNNFTYISLDLKRYTDNSVPN